ncbi:hypothetical protein CEUSTIGMA_g11859.t1 [Chlamydomonas eustigma]|uniref:Amino acid transporter transmembrane domain-containing protein n=1 Tax=Chlamydomonas eustigma TaxID=1157962 RepID=A0A250XNB1_9CHLO|nr:hypothetical protein CEUSTIGMA_g11859.t1 [Chlamydomonas eustigma]|eukprot:GAX84439.1 hypothetical protein CEUSTIGMA_g11859.t1 [Chlamydomonas eustigma]
MAQQGHGHEDTANDSDLNANIASVGIEFSHVNDGSGKTLRNRVSTTGDYAKNSDFDLDGKCREAQAIAGNMNVPQRGGKFFNKDDWFPMEGEPILGYFKRLMFEGHTVIDAFMICACAQVGQIMLNAPASLYRMGMIGGGITVLFFLAVGFWNVYQFMALYMELKRDKIRDGSWWDTDGKHKRIIQIFEVLGHFLGDWAKYLAVVAAVVSLIGVMMTQIIACAADMYSVDPSKNKQTWGLIFGGLMTMIMIWVPYFGNLRMLNLIGLLSVGATSMFIVVDSSFHGMGAKGIKLWPASAQEWFTGAVVWLAILGTHAVIFETLECMEQPKHFKQSFGIAWIWAILVSVPQAYLVNFAYSNIIPTLNTLSAADNALFFIQANSIDDIITQKPATRAKYAAAILMVIHQFIAYAIYGMSLSFIWEKALRVHTKPWYIRVPLRIPLSGFVWFLAMLCPFYGPLNALYASLAAPLLSFVLPSLCMLKRWKSRYDLENSVLKPYKWLRWAPPQLSARLEAINPYYALMLTPWYAINVFMFLFFLGFGGAAIYYSCLTVKQYYVTFGAFAKCYGCLPKAAG